MTTSNFANDIEEAADGQPILAVLIGKEEEWRNPHGVPPEKMGLLLSWADARPLLDYAYDTGFGGADCNAVYAWTERDVLFVCEYDGATHMMAVPRNPTADVEPEMA